MGNVGGSDEHRLRIGRSAGVDRSDMVDNPTNRYSELIIPYMPSWMGTQPQRCPPSLLQWSPPYDLYRPDHLMAWLIPLLGWSGLIITLVFLMLCLLLLLAPRWLKQERLSTPSLPCSFLSHDGLDSKLLSD